MSTLFVCISGSRTTLLHSKMSVVSVVGDAWANCTNCTSLCDGTLLPCSTGVLGSIILMGMYGIILAFGTVKVSVSDLTFS